MPVSGVSNLASSLYNETLATQTSATSSAYSLELDDFFQLLAAQLQYQDMNSPMSNSEMMNQMTQMASMSAMSQLSDAIAQIASVTNNQSELMLTTYSTNMLGKEVTIATVNDDGEVTGEIKGVVSGVDLTDGQYVYVNGSRYSISQIMAVGNVAGNNSTAAGTGSAEAV